jgi:tetratricopeptide (TPR) repeat protein
MGPIRPGRFLTAVVLGVAALATAAGPAAAQIPDEFRNLEVLPEDISRDSLVQLMRSFSFATGLRCEGCHVMGEDGSFQGAEFHLDDKLPKRQARYMLRMVNRLNDEVLPGLPERDAPALHVECKTCHRGIRKPHLLRTELRAVIDTAGVEAAVARYRELREDAMDEGVYDFGVWEMNELARQLEEDGKVAEAAAMLELNEEVHPRAASIPRTLGPLYEALGRTEDAVAAYRRALGLNPGHRRSLERLRALIGKPRKMTP